MEINTKDVLKIISTYCMKNHVSITSFAKSAGVSKAWLSRLLNNPTKKISLAVAEKLLNVAGYKLKIEKKAILIEKKRLIIDAIRR